MNLRISALLLCAAFMTSCATPGSQGTNAAYVHVSPSGNIDIDGKSVPVDQIGPALKDEGFGQRSPINVYVPEEVSQKIMSMITMSLTRSGFTRVMFIKPKQASSDIGPMSIPQEQEGRKTSLKPGSVKSQPTK
jgi:hypothetical protein